MELANKSEEYLLDAWEAQRAIKNLMGKMSYNYIVKKFQEIFSGLWSSRADVCLGVNDGYYNGASAVAGYYDGLYELNALISKLMQKAIPSVLEDKTADEIYGTGTMDYKPVECELIEVAQDGGTAKGLWVLRGSHSQLTPAGPVGYWEWGWFAADFIKEDGKWKIWHLLYLDDVCGVCGTDWVTAPKDLPEMEVFEPIKGYKLPEPNVPVKLRELYSPMRCFTPPPRMPEPYESFSQTFSYGIAEGETENG